MSSSREKDICYSDDPSPDVREIASRTLGSDKYSVEIFNAVKEHELELNRATAAFEHAALRPGIILNGGAAVAFLTLLGALTKQNIGVDGGEELISNINIAEAGTAITVWLARGISCLQALLERTALRATA